MSWPSTDFELQIQAELDALRSLARAAVKMRWKFGDDYPGRFADLDAAIEEWEIVSGQRSP